MHYVFARAAVNFFIDHKLAITGQELEARLQKMIGSYGMDTFPLLWNLMDSHDTDRLASMVVNPDREYDKQGNPRSNPNYDVRKPNGAERHIQEQIVAFQMTFAGAPMIYYGDEAGMWGADDPDDRKPMVWQDLKFAVEKSHPVEGKTRPADTNDFDAPLFATYKKLIGIHNGSAALRLGDYQGLSEITGENSIGFLRTSPHQQAIVVFNRSGQKTSGGISAARLKSKEFQDALTGKKVAVKDGKLPVEVGEKGYLILLSKTF
jgi:cyclomaltodextrinase / maltogenic alpha-amylase / neopullulanase